MATGKLLPGVSMAVCDTTGKILGPREEGELWFKSPYTCIGYLNNPTETEKTFQDRWVRTGDLGYYDEEGFVYVVDRLKYIFWHCGNQVNEKRTIYKVESFVT